MDKSPVNNLEELFDLSAGVTSATSERMERVTELLRQGVNPMSQSVVGSSPFTMAVTQKNWAVVSTMMAIAPEAVKTSKGANAWALADSMAAAGAPASLRGKFFELTREPGVDRAGVALNSPQVEKHYSALLVKAAGAGDLESFTALLNAGVDINSKGHAVYKNGMGTGSLMTALHAAIIHRHPEVALAALERKANPLILMHNGMDATSLALLSAKTDPGMEVLFEPLAEAVCEQMTLDDQANLAEKEAAAEKARVDAEAKALAEKAALQQREERAKAEAEAKVKAEAEAAAKAQRDAEKAARRAEQAALKDSSLEAPDFTAAPVRTPTPAAEQKPALLDPVDVAVGLANDTGKAAIRAMAKHGNKKALKVEQLSFDFGV